MGAYKTQLVSHLLIFDLVIFVLILIFLKKRSLSKLNHTNNVGRRHIFSSPTKLIKPIFHQNAKYLASGVGVGQYTRRQYFALPNAKYTNMLVYFALADANFLRRPCTFLYFCVDFFANPIPSGI